MKTFIPISFLLLLPEVRCQLYGSFFSPYDGPLNGPFGHVPAPSETYSLNRFNNVGAYGNLNGFNNLGAYGNINRFNNLGGYNSLNTVIPGSLPYRGSYSNPWAYGTNSYLYNNRYYVPYGYGEWI